MLNDDKGMSKYFFFFHNRSYGDDHHLNVFSHHYIYFLGLIYSMSFVCVCVKSVCTVLQGVLESFLGTALTGAVFCLLAGQPLTILSSTGPVLVFERLLFNFSK